MEIKVKWEVQPAPTGRYRSFSRRGWPCAFYKDTEDEKPCAMIRCEDDYVPRNIASGNHGPLTLMVADWSDKSAGPSFKWKSVQKKFKTLAEAKEALPRILRANPKVVPDELKEVLTKGERNE